MKALVGAAAFGIIMAVLTGCEGNWQLGGSAGNYNTSGNWQNVSGRYVAANGQWLVSSYSGVSSNTITETVASTVAGQLNYSGTLGNAPLVANTLAISLGSIGAVHDNGSGSLSGSGVTSGSIDYTTGAWSLTLSAAPAAGVGMVATYQTSGSGGAGGSGVSIQTFEVSQAGNVVTFTDNNGSVYKGQIGATSTNSPSGTNVTAISASYSFDVSGVSAAGFNVEMVGHFLVNGGTVISNTVIMTTSMTGTWLEQGGKTGNIAGIRE